MLFSRAVEIDHDERDAFLSSACNGDAALRTEIEQLIEADRGVTEDFLLPPLRIAAGVELKAGAIVGGRYRLMEQIGQGSWGIVWSAEQDRPVQRTVAIKFLRWCDGSDMMLKRFAGEKQSLARLDHPGLARVLDAGSTRRGRPYFVMEFIEGCALHTYCDLHRLSVRERLKLIVSACEAVHHSHTRGVIHRDLKPTNMLVDGDGRVRIIDFGIARLIDAQCVPEAWPTRDGQVLGTPEFMSPEQVCGDADIDPRVDVYAMGAVMHYLLSGVLARRAGAHEADDAALRHERASVLVLREQGEQSDALQRRAEARRCSPAGLSRQLRGDLDAIITCAMASQRGARYGSALELAADIRRHLDKVPIVARKPGPLYGLTRWADRNRVLMASGVTLACVLIGTTMVLGVQHGRLLEAGRLATSRAQEAERERASSQAAQFFLQEMLSRVASMSPNGLNVRMLDVLEEASSRLETGALADEPDIRAQVRRIVGRAYMDLGLFSHAGPHMRAAFDRSMETLPPGHADRLDLLWAVGECEKEMSRFEPAVAAFEQLHVEALLAGPVHESMVFIALNQQGNTLHRMGQSAGALPLLAEACDGLHRTLGPEHIQTAVAMFNEAAALGATGRLADGEQRLRETIGVLSMLDGSHDTLVRSLRTLASRFLRPQGHIAQAEMLLREALETSLGTLGQDHQETNASRLFLGKFLHEHGGHEEARLLVAAHHQHRERHFTTPTLRTLMGMHLLARIDLALNDPPSAMRTVQDMLERIEAAMSMPEREGSEAQWIEYRILSHRAAAQAARMIGDAEVSEIHGREADSWSERLGR